MLIYCTQSENAAYREVRSVQISPVNMGRVIPFLGSILHTTTTSPDTKEELSLGEFPAITSPSVRCVRGDSGA
jgi:hypothetical protein